MKIGRRVWAAIGVGSLGLCVLSLATEWGRIKALEYIIIAIEKFDAVWPQEGLLDVSVDSWVLLALWTSPLALLVVWMIRGRVVLRRELNNVEERLARIEGFVRDASPAPARQPSPPTEELRPATGDSEPTEPSASPRPALKSGPTIPRVVMGAEVLEAMQKEIRVHLDEGNESETGFAFVGEFVDGTTREIRISGLIGIGPKGDCSTGHVQFDREWQEAQLGLMRLENPSLSWTGDSHLHPGSMTRCSDGDYRTDLANARASVSQELVFCIMTSHPSDPSESESMAIFGRGLRADFYYLGEASGYEYARVVPEIIDIPKVELPSAWKAMDTKASIRTSHDVRSLKGIEGLRFEISEVGAEAPDSFSLTIEDDTHGWNAVMLCPQGNAPEILISRRDEAKEVMECRTLADWTAQSWLSPLVLELSMEMRATGHV